MSGIPHHHAPPVRPARIASAAACAAFLTIAIAACGSSSSSSQAATSAVLGSSVQQDCTTIGDILSDGPDPDADSVGYAQAQVLPLRQIHTSDAKLHQSIDTLASAYQAFSSSNGSSSAKSAVSAASKTIEHLCPGIES